MKKKSTYLFGLCIAALLAVVNANLSAGDITGFLGSPGTPKGGVIVYLGSADANALVSARNAGHFSAQGVLFDTASVDAARKAIFAKKAYGMASVIECTSKILPYTDNFVNIVAIDNPAAVSASGIPAADIGRIVAPRGVVMVSGDDAFAQSIAKAMGSQETSKVGEWTVIVKPRPKEMDDWTHARHDPERTSTSTDTLIKPSSTLQWRQGPICLWPGVSSRIADGKNFYEANSVLTCRDSFNGTLLWSKPVVRERSFTVWGKRVYVFVPEKKHLVALDNSTGKIVQEYKEIVGVAI